MASPNPNESQKQDNTYQIGAGVPLNQQYLQPQDATQAVASAGTPQHQVYNPPTSSADTKVYPPPPSSYYNPGGLDVSAHSAQQISSPPQAAPASFGSSGHDLPPLVGQPQEEVPPPKPPRPEQAFISSTTIDQGIETKQQAVESVLADMSLNEQQRSEKLDALYNSTAPEVASVEKPSADQQQFPLPPTSFGNPVGVAYPAPPRRISTQLDDDDPSSPIHYTRDPHKLVGYLVPFPKPVLKGIKQSDIPDRYLIYTPPPPPLTAPKEGEKEEKLHKVQRKWQDEVRKAKTSEAKTASWAGIKSKATVGISWAINKTTTSNLDFVNRIPTRSTSPTSSKEKDVHHNDGIAEDTTTHKTVGLEELVLIYPSSISSSPENVKAEFINTMMRTKSKAQRDSIIATGLLPVSAAIDILATLIWPFGGLLEVDAVWAYSSIRGAKTARNVTKRLSSSTSTSSTPSDNISAPSSSPSTNSEDKQLHLTFTPSPRLATLEHYLATVCRDRDAKMFPSSSSSFAPRPTELEVLEAIGWAPSQHYGHREDGERNWEDEAWEREEVKADVRSMFGKAAREWERWCKGFEKGKGK